MNVLIACEESQTVCKAFRSKGHNAFSCDVVNCSGGYPEWHIKSDVLPLLNGHCEFYTSDNTHHFINDSWDLIIAHPPCTYLTKASATRLFPNGVIDNNRYSLGLAARDFFISILNADCKKICVENPTPLSIFELPAATQVIEPFYFGDPFTKRTLLWLKGLPILFPTCMCIPENSYVLTTSSAKKRSKTFTGIAAAMAEQWG